MHDPTDLRQHRIAHCMTVGIVDPLEMVEVHQRESEGRLLRGPELAVEHVEKRSAVGQAGERIGACFARGICSSSSLRSVTSRMVTTKPEALLRDVSMARSFASSQRVSPSCSTDRSRILV